MHDSLMNIHDSLMYMHDSLMNVHDSLIYMHDSLMNIHDSLMNVHDSLMYMHDSSMNIHDSLMNIHDSLMHMHDSWMHRNVLPAEETPVVDEAGKVAERGAVCPVLEENHLEAERDGKTAGDQVGYGKIYQQLSWNEQMNRYPKETRPERLKSALYLRLKKCNVLKI